MYCQTAGIWKRVVSRRCASVMVAINLGEDLVEDCNVA